MSLQPTQTRRSSAPAISLPDAPILCVNTRQAALLTAEGELRILPLAQAQIAIHKKPVIVCHAPYTRQRLGVETMAGIDILELFAFVHPATFCVPTPAGLAKALGLIPPQDLEDAPATLMAAAQALLGDLQREDRQGQKADPLEIAKAMGQNGNGWAWTPFICRALGEEYNPALPVMSKAAMNFWKYMPEWSEQAPPPAPAHHAVTGEESRARLAEILGADAEIRPQQKDYAARMAAAFMPRDEAEKPHVVLAEAGTGVGKTLGYLSPASIWAEKNKGSVWISTYTKNLQRQIDRELARLYPHPEVKKGKVTIRKGRENYLCLLNMEDAIAGASLARHATQVIAAGIMARWAAASRDGDLTGGDFPGWLSGILGFAPTTGLADKRGECVYSACDHYHRCFVERAVRKSQHADIVVANHALVMVKAAVAGPDDLLPQRYVFDEAHHLFDAADSAFAGHLTARETHNLRRWLRGAEGGRQSRARGLKRRAEDLLAGDAEAAAMLETIIHEARALPALGWSRRLRDKNPDGATEEFLAMVYQQVYARAGADGGPYSLETEVRPLIDGLADAGQRLALKLRAIQAPMRALAVHFRKRLSEQAQTLDSDSRKRIEAVAAGLERRAESTLSGWIGMLDTLQLPETPAQFVDWLEIERFDGNAIDVGLYRHWIDPMLPFAKSILPFAHGIAMTSATLRDGTGDEDEDWRVARTITGAHFVSDSPIQFSEKSPFDYAAQTRIIVITDVRKTDLNQVAGAFRALFAAAGGGALGLFTAINRLKAVHEKIAGALEDSGLPLYAQHVDDIDTGTLVDIFREDIHACLLGTDAVRDGIDVPGESLRLLVYDRVPWPRPTILHKARREAFGGRRYDEMITRLKLRQAYGRLIRRAGDTGVFVMLDSALPTRLHGAFPEGVPVQRLGLADALARIKEFSNPAANRQGATD